MQIELKSDQPISDDACLAATGKTLGQWYSLLDAKVELIGKRRDTINWLYDETGKDSFWPATLWVEYQRVKGVVLRDGKPDGYNICSTKTVGRPIEEVFAAFSNGQLGAWFGDGARADSGGSFSDSHGNLAIATRVRPEKDIRYRWKTAGSTDESEVEVLFADKAGKTSIVLNHNRIQSRAEADGLRRAWGDALGRLKSLMESEG